MALPLWMALVSVWPRNRVHSDGGGGGLSVSERMNKSEVRSLTRVAHRHFKNVVLQRQDHECKSICSATAKLRITKCIEVFKAISLPPPLSYPYYCIKDLEDAAAKSTEKKRLKFVQSARSVRDHRHPFLIVFLYE